MIGTRMFLGNKGSIMRTVIQFIRLGSPTRPLLLFVLFCVFFLASCAAGDDLEPISDAGFRPDRPLDSKVDADTTIPMFDQLPRVDASTSQMDVAWSNDISANLPVRDANMASTSDTELSQFPRDAATDSELSFPPPPDAMSMPIECHTLTIHLNATTMPLCSRGWSSILYDFDGHPHESTPGGTLSYSICGRLQGQLVLSAHCGGMYLLDWPGVRGAPANRGGVASITLDGNELADAEALLCLDRWSRTPGVRPVIPLEPYFYGRCP